MSPRLPVEDGPAALLNEPRPVAAALASLARRCWSATARWARCIAGIWDIDGLGLSEMLNGLNEGRDHHGTPLGRPTAFVIGARIQPAADDVDRQVRSVRAKIAAGASYLISPPVFDVDALARLLGAAGAGDLPVLLGVMPPRDFRHAEYLQHEVPDMAGPAASLPAGSPERATADADLAELERLRAALQTAQAQNATLRQLVAVHDRLGGLVLQGADDAAITSLLSDLVGRRVLLLDVMMETVAISGGDADHSSAVAGWSPSTAYVNRILRTLADERRPLRVPPLVAFGVDVGCVVTPIVVGDAILGYLVMLEDGPDERRAGVDLKIVAGTGAAPRLLGEAEEGALPGAPSLHQKSTATTSTTRTD